ncbi:ABC transporter ATP-binding protein [Propionivibrio sp.]|uniref:ABC transporter ATP-binding protein n=1 Tax=Propionivibrio sp. TaxID=2212460 RepID=UPI0039E5E9A5
MAELLKVENVWSGYGDSIVLEEVSFALDEGDSLALLGRNGMGKTTLLSTLMGATRFKSGRMVFQGRDLAAVPGHARAHLGLGWVPQERDIFPSLTVEENLTVVARPGPWNLPRVYEMFPRLEERKRNMGNQLSGGEQQMLAIARALMLNPRLLLLDEPLEGLAPLIVQDLLGIIGRMVGSGDVGVILVEQHAHQILPMTRQALVLERGRVVYSGESRELRKDRERLDRWLGVGGH